MEEDGSDDDDETSDDTMAPGESEEEVRFKTYVFLEAIQTVYHTHKQ